MSKDTSIPAFPRTGAKHEHPISGPASQDGMTLRDYFAAKAMQGDWAAQTVDMGYWTNDANGSVLEDRAALYYRMADAMLKAREA